MSNNGTQTGSVKFFNAARGFGFLVPDNKACEDVFFHVSSLAPGVTPTERQRVEFSVGKARDGRLRAEMVKVL